MEETLRRTLRVVLGVLGAVLLVVLSAGPAAAHATLVASSPAGGEVLERSPEEITLTFSEEVEVLADGLQVLDREGIDRAEEITGGGRTLTAALEELEDGTYLVVWKVPSVDTHVVSGSYPFSVGAPGEAYAAPSGNGSAQYSRVAARAITYSGMALALGSVLVAIATRTLPGQVRNAGLIGAAALAVGAVGSVGAYAGELGTNPWPALTGSVGQLAGVRIVLAGSIALALLKLSGRGRAAALGTLGVLIAATGGLDAHARGEGMSALVVAGVHTLSAGAWVGGIVMVLLVRELAPRLSPYLIVMVALLVGTGVAQSLAWIPDLAALESRYGVVLLVKTVLVAGMLLLGALSWRTVRRGANPLMSARGEALLSLGVIAATSLLTGTPPPEPTRLETERIEDGVTLTVEVVGEGFGRLTLDVRCGAEAGCEDDTGQEGVAAEVTARIIEDTPSAVALTGQDERYEGQIRVPEGEFLLEVVVRRNALDASVFQLPVPGR